MPSVLQSKILPAILRATLRVVDTLFWYAYLGLLIWASFLNGQIDSQPWLIFASCTYLLLAAHCCSVFFGGRANILGLRLAIAAIILLLLTLLLLYLQTVLPLNTYLHDLILSSNYVSGYETDWFKPNSVWSVVPALTHWLLMSELLMVTFFVLTISLLCSRRRLQQFLVVMIAIGLVHTVVGIIAKYAGISLVDKVHLDGHFGVARAWFINRNHFASFIGLTLIGALALQLKYLLSSQGKTLMRLLLDQLITGKAVILFALSCTVVALLLSQSRAGFLAPVLSIAICFFALGRGSSRFGKKRQFIMPVVVFLAVSLIYFGGDFLARISADSLSLGERTKQWALSWAAIQKAWLLGYGGNSYGTVFQAFRDPDQFRQLYFNQAHNDYLHIWLEQGLIGLLLWIGLLMVTLRRALISFSSHSSTMVGGVSMAAAVVLIAALLQSFVDFNLHILNIRLYFFVIMATVFAVASIKQRKGSSKSLFFI